MVFAAPRGEAAAVPWREAYIEGSSRTDDKGQANAEVRDREGAVDAGIGRGVGVGGTTGQGGEGCAGGPSVSSRNREAGWLRGAGTVEAGGTGDHRVGCHSQAEDQQGDTVKGGALQAGAEEHLQGGRQGNGGAIGGDDGRGVGHELGVSRDDNKPGYAGVAEHEQAGRAGGGRRSREAEVLGMHAHVHE